MSLILYMDTSALLKLFVEEDGSEQVRDSVKQADEVVTCVATYAEARAAFARSRRNEERVAQDLDLAQLKFEQAWRAMGLCEIGSGLAREAGHLAERYALQGCDSLQLASFAHVRRVLAPDEVQFSSADVKLAKAAKRLVEDVLADLPIPPAPGSNPPAGHSPGADSVSLN